MKTESNQFATDITIRVIGISPSGFWLFAENEELFLSFKEFPWFENAPVKSVFNVQKQGRNGFCWPDLDVDLTLDSIKSHDKYPLKATVLK